MAVQGIELSRRFYLEVVAPWLARCFPDLRHAAAILGYGSELLGFDDEISRDHNWGPRVWLYVSEEELEARGAALVEAFAREAPDAFLGIPLGFFSRPHPPTSGDGVRAHIGHGLEVRTVAGAIVGALAILPGEPLDALAWLGFAEQKLLTLTAGEVFHDGVGELTAMRERFAWFPRDVWLYKLACQWRRIAEEQAFVGRAGLVGDDLGSRVIAGRLSRDVMRLAFLLERRYAPYPKWFGTAFGRLPAAAALRAPLSRALAAADWRDREKGVADACVAAAEIACARRIPGSIPAVAGRYFGRPFTVVNAEELVGAYRAEIEDPALASLPVIGSLDQVTDSTPVIEAPARARRAMRSLLQAP